MAKFRKKPVEIEAFRFGRDKPPVWWREAVDKEVAIIFNGMSDNAFASIETLEGIMNARRGDWIIRGVKGDLYPCKPDIFEATYEPVS